MRPRYVLALSGILGICLAIAGCKGNTDVDLGNGYTLIATKTDEAKKLAATKLSAPK